MVYAVAAPGGREALGRAKQGGADQAPPLGGFGEGMGSECVCVGGGGGKKRARKNSENRREGRKQKRALSRD